MNVGVWRTTNIIQASTLLDLNLNLVGTPTTSESLNFGTAPFLPTDLRSPPSSLKPARQESLTGNCVVCQASNSGYHFGCIACAACSAFFRRTVALNRKYKCRRDPTMSTKCPLDRKHRSNCKACRFSRCLDMGMNPSGVQNLRDTIRCRSIDADNQEYSQSSLKKSQPSPQPSEWSSSYCGEEENLIEILENVYKKTLERRRMFYCEGTIQEILSGTKLRMRPTKFDERYYKDTIRFELVNYLEMMNSIQCFRQLDCSTKEALVRNCAVTIAMIEKYYTSIQNSGLELNRIIAPDGSYTDLGDHGAQFDDKNFEKSLIDKETCLKLLYDPLREVLHELGTAMKHAKMNDIEFCALFAVVLFNTAAETLSDEERLKVGEARNRILKDWFDLYQKQGVDPCEASELVGNTLLLITAVRNGLSVHRENFHVIRVFNIMEYDKIIDDFAFS